MKHLLSCKPLYLALQLALIIILMAACAPLDSSGNPDEVNKTNENEAPDSGETQTEAVAITPTANLSDSCVETYDPNIDYFPEKTSLTYAEGLTIEYFNHYKVVTVLNPWRDAEETFQYALVQCGTPIPEGFAEAQVIETPINSIITMSSTQLPHLDSLGVLDKLLGHDSLAFINTPNVIELIQAGKIAEIGWGPQVNIELVLDLNPDLVMTYALGNPDSDAHPKLLEAGLKVAMNGSYMDTSPLGRAEWLKFMALFFNQEAKAEAIFQEMAAQYEAIAAKVRDVDHKPTVFTGIQRGDSWRVTGGNSYFAQYLADAGTTYLWADDESTGSIPLDFETVYDHASEADFWLNTSTWASLDEVLAADERYAEFGALKRGQIYNNNVRVNENGGNDYWESGVANPHLVLADLVKIFHPDLLPDHDLIYYQQLK